MCDYILQSAYWREYCELEMENGTPEATKMLFGRCLLRCLEVDLWRVYLRFIRTLNDPRGAEGLLEIRQAMEFALDHVGQDLRAGPIWQEYVLFLMEPKVGTPEFEALFGKGPEGQEETQRITAVRRSYHRALIVPSAALENLWIGYERFESSTGNKTLAKRSLDEWRPKYQAAHAQVSERTRLVERLDMRALPIPPGRGGTQQARQAVAWREYLQWERSNVQEVDSITYQARVVLAYEQCLTILLQFPDIWLDFASWHWSSSGAGQSAAAAVLHRGCTSLPSSLSLHFAASEMEESIGAIDKAKEIFENLLEKTVPKLEKKDAAPDSTATDKNLATEPEPLNPQNPGEESTKSIVLEKSKVTNDTTEGENGESHSMGRNLENSNSSPLENNSAGDQKEASEVPKQENDEANKEIVDPKASNVASIHKLTHREKSSRIFSDEDGTLIWIQYMRFTRRVDGIMAARKLFLRARKWPGLQWQAFAASAALEWSHEAKSQIPRNIFELGLKTHMQEPMYVLEYAKFLRGLGDISNCRALFERVLTAIPASTSGPIWDAYLQFESEVGNLLSISSIESRRQEAMRDIDNVDVALDAARIAVLKYRFLDLWPSSELYLRSILPETEVAFSGALSSIIEDSEVTGVAPDTDEHVTQVFDFQPRRPDMRRRYPPQRGRGRQGRGGRPMYEPIEHLPRELHILRSTVERMQISGPYPDVDKVIEVILRADFSAQGIEAHEAAAARERRRQRHQISGVESGPDHQNLNTTRMKRKLVHGAVEGINQSPESDTESSEDDGDDDLATGLDIYRRRMRARV